MEAWDGIIAALIGLVGIWLTWRLNRIHRQFNSRMDEMMKLVAESSHAEGVKDGIQQQKDEEKKGN